MNADKNDLTGPFPNFLFGLSNLVDLILGKEKVMCIILAFAFEPFLILFMVLCFASLFLPFRLQDKINLMDPFQKKLKRWRN